MGGWTTVYTKPHRESFCRLVWFPFGWAGWPIWNLYWANRHATTWRSNIRTTSKLG